MTTHKNHGIEYRMTDKYKYINLQIGWEHYHKIQDLLTRRMFHTLSDFVRTAIRYWLSRHFRCGTPSSTATTIPDFDREKRALDPQYHTSINTQIQAVLPKPLVWQVKHLMEYRLFQNIAHFTRYCIQYWFDAHPYFFTDTRPIERPACIEHRNHVYYLRTHSLMPNTNDTENPYQIFGCSNAMESEVKMILDAGAFMSQNLLINTCIHFWLSRHLYYDPPYHMPKEPAAEQLGLKYQRKTGKKVIGLYLNTFIKHVISILLELQIFPSNSAFFRYCFGYWRYYHPSIEETYDPRQIEISFAGRTLPYSVRTTHAPPEALLRYENNTIIPLKAVSDPYWFEKYQLNITDEQVYVLLPQSHGESNYPKTSYRVPINRECFSEEYLDKYVRPEMTEVERK